MGMLMYDALVLKRASQDIATKQSCLTLGVPTLNFTDRHYFDQVRGDADPGQTGETPFDTAAGFFAQLGFEQVSALDISDYEGADIVGDLNDPDLQRKLGRRFDLVYDSGTIEHIFDAPAALRTIAGLWQRNTPRWRNVFSDRRSSSACQRWRRAIRLLRLQEIEKVKGLLRVCVEPADGGGVTGSLHARQQVDDGVAHRGEYLRG